MARLALTMPNRPGFQRTFKGSVIATDTNPAGSGELHPTPNALNPYLAKYPGLVLATRSPRETSTLISRHLPSCTAGVGGW